MKAAVDTSVLIAFGKLGHLGLLTQLFDGLFLAKSVLDEVRGSEVYAEVERLMDVGSVSVAEASNCELLDILSSGLDRVYAGYHSSSRATGRLGGRALDRGKSGRKCLDPRWR